VACVAPAAAARGGKRGAARALGAILNTAAAVLEVSAAAAAGEVQRPSDGEVDPESLEAAMNEAAAELGRQLQKRIDARCQALGRALAGPGGLRERLREVQDAAQSDAPCAAGRRGQPSGEGGLHWATFRATVSLGSLRAQHSQQMSGRIGAGPTAGPRFRNTGPDWKSGSRVMDFRLRLLVC
jgi:hypothetical protein